MVATTFGVGQVVYTLLWVFAFFVQVWLMVTVFVDLFRSDDLSGWAKAGWVVLTIVLPFVGIVTYLIFRGDQMRVHHYQAQRQAEARLEADLRNVTGSSRSKSEEIAHLAELHDRGILTTEEFQHLKAEVIGKVPGTGERTHLASTGHNAG